ncbi:MAG: SDR family NAD(P)-dependent oxidoreductase [Pseudomonadota bacterium]
MSETLHEKTALITGASRGLGAALALALAEAGHHVIAVARTVGGLEELDDRIKAVDGAATLAPMDITVDAAMQQLCRSIYDRWGGLDLWVHTAIHAAPLSPAPSISERDWARSVAVNLDAPRRLIVYLSPLLTARPEARALFFDDPDAQGKFFGAYGATKQGQMALVRSWQAETRRTGPAVEILTPDPMPTAVRGRFYPGEDRSQLTHPRDVAARLLAARAAAAP